MEKIQTYFSDDEPRRERFVKMLLGRIFVQKKQEVTDIPIKLHNEKLNNLYSLLNINNILGCIRNCHGLMGYPYKTLSRNKDWKT
jgi:hypothetical protein